jgi:hypothetical protein
MSLFSYIAFPRQADTSCIKREIDKEPRKSWMDADPYDFEKACYGISMHDWHEAVFCGVFTNQFIYCLDCTFRFIDEEKTIETYRYNQNRLSEGGASAVNLDLDYIRFTIKCNNECAAICRKQLYDIILLNTEPGEIVEIYTTYVYDYNDNYDYGPPENETILGEEQVLTSELLNLTGRTKIVIKRKISEN